MNGPRFWEMRQIDNFSNMHMHNKHKGIALYSWRKRLVLLNFLYYAKDSIIIFLNI